MGYVENFLYMMDRLNENNFQPHPKLVRALEVLFILHAEHELNCSTAAVRYKVGAIIDICVHPEWMYTLASPELQVLFTVPSTVVPMKLC